MRSCGLCGAAPPLPKGTHPFRVTCDDGRRGGGRGRWRAAAGGVAETWRQAFLLLVQSVGLNWRAVREARAERDEERREKEALLDFFMDQALRDVDEEDGDEHEEALGELLREAVRCIPGKSGNVAVVRRVLAEGADVNEEDENGKTALMWAAFLDDREEVVRVLLEAGAAPNKRDQLGRTALHQATTSVPIARLLLEAGADPSLRSNGGRTALDVCEYCAADEDDTPQFREKNAAVARLLREWPLPQQQ